MHATKESPRMFEQDWLDMLSRTPWWTVPLLWLPGSGALFGYGVLVAQTPWWQAVLLGMGGWLMWTFTEYGLHRTFFHWIPEGRWGARMHFLVHGVHHQWHQDRFRLVMPPAVSLLLGVLFGGLFFGLSHLIAQPGWFWTFYAGFTFGYMFYDVAHYAIHHLKFKHPWFLALKKHHLLHHHSPKYAERKFGVSTTLWDHVFGTF